MARASLFNSSKSTLSFPLCKQRRLVWWISGIGLSLSILGLILCFINPSIRAPLRPGLEFTGGTQIQLERVCNGSCEPISTSIVVDAVSVLSLPKEGGISGPKLSQVKVQLLDGSKTLVLRMKIYPSSIPCHSL